MEIPDPGSIFTFNITSFFVFAFPLNALIIEIAQKNYCKSQNKVIKFDAGRGNQVKVKQADFHKPIPP